MGSNDVTGTVLSEDAQKSEIRTISLIDLNLSLQTRSSIRNSAVAEYANRYSNGEPMDLPVVYDISGVLYLADGFHREAAQRLILNRREIECRVFKGSKWQAVQCGLKANLRHLGERPNRADRENATKIALRMRPDLSNSAIAKLVGVSDNTVRAYRLKLEATGEISKLETHIGLDGRERPAEKLVSKPEPSATTMTDAAERPGESTNLAGQEEVAVPIEDTASPGTDQADRSNPASVPAVVAVIDPARCSCGGSWESDGNGGRFCIRCNQAHPNDPKPVEEDDFLKPWVTPSTDQQSSASKPSYDPILPLLADAMRKSAKVRDAIHLLKPFKRSRYYTAEKLLRQFTNELEQWWDCEGGTLDLFVGPNKI